MRKRLPLALAVGLLLTGALAGCLERRGTLAIELVVSDAGAIREFRTVNLTLRDVQIDARSLNPERFPSSVDRLELVNAARTGQTFPLFGQEVRADRYDKITLTTPPGATFQGVLLDGRTVAVVVPNNVLVLVTSFEVPRGGASTYTFTVQVLKNDPGIGSPTYSIVPDPELSGPR